MLRSLETYLLAHWKHLPEQHPTPRRLAFLGQATGVSKACFFVFADAQTQPCYIVKTPRSPVYNDHLLREAAMIEHLRTTVSAGLRDTLPGPMHVTQLDDQVVVIEPVLRGQPLDSLAPAKAPLDRRTTGRQLELASRWLIKIQQEATPQQEPLSAEAIQQHLLEPLETLRRQTELTPEEDDYVAQVAERARALKGQRLPLVLYHGDFRAGNILVHRNRIAVLDWEFSCPLALPLLDWFSFVFRVYSRSVNLPDIDGPLAAYRAAFREVFFGRDWFSRMVVDYTQAYCKALAIDEAHVPLLFDFFVVTNINKFYTFLAGRSSRGYLYLLRDAPNAGKPYHQQLRRQAYTYLLGDLAAHRDALTLRSMASEPSRIGRAYVE